MRFGRVGPIAELFLGGRRALEENLLKVLFNPDKEFCVFDCRYAYLCGKSRSN